MLQRCREEKEGSRAKRPNEDTFEDMQMQVDGSESEEVDIKGTRPIQELKS